MIATYKNFGEPDVEPDRDHTVEEMLSTSDTKFYCIVAFPPLDPGVRLVSPCPLWPFLLAFALARNLRNPSGIGAEREVPLDSGFSSRARFCPLGTPDQSGPPWSYDLQGFSPGLDPGDSPGQHPKASKVLNLGYPNHTQGSDLPRLVLLL